MLHPTSLFRDGDQSLVCETDTFSIPSTDGLDPSVQRPGRRKAKELEHLYRGRCNTGLSPRTSNISKRIQSVVVEH
jgi:hypothetical protein